MAHCILNSMQRSAQNVRGTAHRLFSELYQRRIGIFIIGVLVMSLVTVSTLGLQWIRSVQTQKEDIAAQLAASLRQLEITNENLQKTEEQLNALKNEDQAVKNASLSADLQQIKKTYQQAVNTYEFLLGLKEQTAKTSKQDELFARALTDLAKANYASAAATLSVLRSSIQSEKDTLAQTFAIPAAVPEKNEAPGNGYRRQKVVVEGQSYLVDIVAGDLNSTRVIVDTASDSTCANDCPVLPLADYVARNGAFAGINGSYFCPATYPSCADRKNAFDTLLMNKNKVYFNSDNNVYSTVPLVVFSGNGARFVGQSLEWGRDTGVDAVLANQPMLVSNGNNVFGSASDPKHTSKGPRGFVGATGSTAYIGFVHNATLPEAAAVLQAMGVQNALNLDSGGSSALWFGGYKVGPGRNIPNALLFVRK